VKRIKTIAVAAGVAAAATSLSVGAWAATGDSRPAPKKKTAVAQPTVNAAAEPADAKASDLQPKSAPTGLVKSGQVLRAGKFVRSPNGKYRLIQQTDGNLVLYQGKKALWSTVTGKHPGAYTAMQTDGNLVVYSKSKKPLWYSNTAGNSGAELAVQDDGNLVIYSAAKKALWSRHMAIGSLNSGQKLSTGNAVRSTNRVYTLQQQTDGNLVLYKDGKTPIWSTSTKGANVYALMQTDGNFVVYQGTKPLWSTGTGGNPGSSIAVQDDGNLVVYSKDKKAIWSSRK
jgi:hypothetical protein